MKKKNFPTHHSSAEFLILPIVHKYQNDAVSPASKDKIVSTEDGSTIIVAKRGGRLAVSAFN